MLLEEMGAMPMGLSLQHSQVTEAQCIVQTPGGVAMLCEQAPDGALVASSALTAQLQSIPSATTVAPLGTDMAHTEHFSAAVPLP